MPGSSAVITPSAPSPPVWAAGNRAGAPPVPPRRRHPLVARKKPSFHRSAASPCPVSRGWDVRAARRPATKPNRVGLLRGQKDRHDSARPPMMPIPTLARLLEEARTVGPLPVVVAGAENDTALTAVAHARRKRIAEGLLVGGEGALRARPAGLG